MAAAELPKTTAEMRQWLRDRGVDDKKALEKQDLLDLVHDAVAKNLPVLDKPYPVATLLHGSDLENNAGDLIPVASLRGKYVGLYFSAHWCPPCRQFTPLLAKFYQKNKDNLEIVFISRDQDAVSFAEYFEHHPWLALPFENRAVAMELARRYDVKGIPCLLFFTPEGQFYNASGVELVYTRPSAFPWRK